MAEVGMRIRERREALGMTQEELASRLGYKNKSTIAKIETGANDIVLSKVVEFANALNTSIAYLMGWEPNNAPFSYDIELPNGIKLEISGEKQQEDFVKRIAAYAKLIDANRKKADNYIDTLLSMQDMEDNLALAAAHKRTDIETTAEMHQHDDDIMNDDSEWE